jgi:hypothetical protein
VQKIEASLRNTAARMGADAIVIVSDRMEVTGAMIIRSVAWPFRAADCGTRRGRRGHQILGRYGKLIWSRANQRANQKQPGNRAEGMSTRLVQAAAIFSRKILKPQSDGRKHLRKEPIR